MWLLFHETFPAQERHKTVSPSLNLLHRFAFFLCSMGLLCFIYCIASTCTNLVFFFIFLLLVATFGCLAVAFWHNAQGHAATGATLQHVGAALAFVIRLLGRYIFFVLILAAVDFPYRLPLRDLSTVVKGASEKKLKDNSNV
jgi:succinate-acetate transporter protein